MLYKRLDNGKLQWPKDEKLICRLAGFRPDVESKIKKMSDTEAKAALLKLVALIPDAGIALMN